MRLTQILKKQHIGRMTKKHWFLKSNRDISEDGAEISLRSKGIQISDPSELFPPKRIPERIEFRDPLVQPVPERDETHPNWHDSVCLMYGDNDLLVEGLPQAQVLTKTIKIEHVLPKELETSVFDNPNKIDDIVLRSILTSNLFDAHQELLPVVKDPKRPAWNFPRDMGITSAKKSFNLLHKLLQLCESLSGPKVAFQRSVIDRSIVTVPIEKDLDLLQFSLTLDVAVTSKMPLKPIAEEEFDQELPNLYPMNHKISLRKENIYLNENKYPIDWEHPKPYIHTILIHHDPVQVKNLTELPTRETQILARNMLKAFTAAASCARKRYGEFVKDLPEPVTVQCIQTEGHTFHFSILQLNTLNISGGNGIKNYWWSIPRLKLFEKADYIDGKPQLIGYNPEVFKNILSFYNRN